MTSYRKRPNEAGLEELQSLILKYDRRLADDHKKLGHDLIQSPIPPIEIPKIKDPSDPDLETRDNKEDRKEVEEEMRQKIEYYEALAYHRGVGMERPKMSLNGYAPGTILNIRRKTRVEKLAEKLIRPIKFVPPVHLAEWTTLPLDNKIPLVAIGLPMSYSRGQVGETLYKKFKKRAFTLEDPLHQRSVPEYSPLHDPHLKAHFQKPTVMNSIREQGLVDDEGHVVCSVAELNRYRLYLRHNYYNAVHNQLRHMDKREINIRKVNYVLAKYKASSQKTVPKVPKRVKDMKDHPWRPESEHAKEKERPTADSNVKKDENKDAEEEQKLRDAWSKKMHDANKRNYLKKMRQLKRERAKQVEQERIEMLKLKFEYKQERAERLIEERREVMKQAARQYELERLDAKYEYQLAYLQHSEGIGQALRDELKEKAKKYLEEVEYRRAAMTDQIRRARARKARADFLEKKYFYRWMDIIRERKEKPPNVGHLTLWDIPQITHDCVEFLHEKSGHVVRMNEVLQGALRQNAARLRRLARLQKRKKMKERSEFSEAHFKNTEPDDLVEEDVK